MKGHMRKRSKGSWTIWVDIGRDPETGRRKQQSFTVRGSKKDAERELRAILTRIEGGAHVKPTKLTVGEYHYSLSVSRTTIAKLSSQGGKTETAGYRPRRFAITTWCFAKP